MARESTIYTYIAGLLTNNSMLPSSIFDVSTRLVLTAHARRGSDNAFSTRMYEKYFAEEHTLFKPEQPFYTNSIDLLILQERLRYLLFELRHVEHGQICISATFRVGEPPRSRAAIR